MILGKGGFDLITEIEGLKLNSYRDSAGVWTIGYGTTRLNGYPVKKGMIINESVAIALFHGDISDTIESITNVVHVKLNQNQFDALVSLAYNIGDFGFASSTLCRVINADGKVVENHFTRWNKYTDPVTKKKLVSNGLTRRRKLEYQLFMKVD